MPSRRRYLAAVGASALATVAGCSGVTGRPAPSDPPAPETPPLDEDRQIYGSDGNWSSFGCNAGNTRSVHGIHAGEAPVDGVSEDWRVEVSGLQNRAPVVADGRVFLSGPEGLRVLDAADGSVLWHVDEIRHAPVVRGQTVYVADRSDPAVRALAADTGEPRWRVGTEATPVGPSMYPGSPLIVGAGERVHALDPDSGEQVWSRRLFGRVLSHPPVWSGFAVAVATDAGQVSLLSLDDGVGIHRTNLPARPTCPPSADTDAVYVTCLDGTTYALGGDQNGWGGSWTVDTQWTQGGLAIDSGLVFAGSVGDLHAIDSETGEVQWTHAVGEWDQTAPALGRDTLFVGGDRLWALDPTEGGGEAGPPVRFEQSFHGPVGPGPVLDGGTLYVVAETGESSTHLLALS
ncbi:PQQ-binding-like beta-propeller repeat protein [Halobaculum lipolyticum]|uniref:PQQ-binding-like beta-propeller repeat protein n=1 Tax=Halobaculum lipolyticum TaxID=3032001 RepID=A0ABD5WBZ4_9EURY|nr:PQQ-binding-like beta-propeller repeat protein [Halobaculum sp. DT31]